MLKYLVEHGANINKKEILTETLLHYACKRKNGNENIVKYLVEHGADINKQNEYGKIPLHYACEYEHENIVKYLVDFGSDINKQDRYKETALQYACRSGSENIVEYLIEKGAEVDKMIVIRDGYYLNYHIKKNLIKHGAVEPTISYRIKKIFKKHLFYLF